MPTAYLLLGGNQGDRTFFLLSAATLLEHRVGTVNGKSRIYETAAWGLEDQPAFLNQLIQINTALSPTALLAQINLIEKELGRERKIKWGARVIDIDILYYDQEVIELPDLVVPHPRLQDRRFALMPLVELAPFFVHPIFQKTNQTLLAECPDSLPVAVYEK